MRADWVPLRLFLYFCSCALLLRRSLFSVLSSPIGSASLIFPFEVLGLRCPRKVLAGK
jgi:hypothetical protein